MFSCPICCEAFKEDDNVCATTCGHVYHLNCLEQWCRKHNNCPQCRVETPTKMKIFPNFESNPNYISNEAALNEMKIKFAEQKSILDQQLQANRDQNIEITSLKARVTELIMKMVDKDTEINELQQIQESMSNEIIEKNLQNQNKIYNFQIEIAELVTLRDDKIRQLEDLQELYRMSQSSVTELQETLQKTRKAHKKIYQASEEMFAELQNKIQKSSNAFNKLLLQIDDLKLYCIYYNQSCSEKRSVLFRLEFKLKC